MAVDCFNPKKPDVITKVDSIPVHVEDIDFTNSLTVKIIQHPGSRLITINTYVRETEEMVVVTSYFVDVPEEIKTLFDWLRDKLESVETLYIDTEDYDLRSYFARPINLKYVTVPNERKINKSYIKGLEYLTIINYKEMDKSMTFEEVDENVIEEKLS